MLRAATFAAACLAVALLATPGIAQPRSAQAAAQARIVEGGNVRLMFPMAMPSVTVSRRGGALFAGSVPSAGMRAGPTPGNRGLTVRRDDEDESAAMTVPGSFTVVRLEGAETVMLRTSTAAGYGVIGDGVLMGGALLDGSAASIDVGAELWMASADAPQAAPQQTLVVVVQYN